MDIKQAQIGINFRGGTADISELNSATEKAKTLSSKEIRDKKQLDKAAKGFEALLLQDMLKSMWETVEVKGWLGEDSNEAKIYRDMMNQAIADSIAEGKGIGIKDVVKKELGKQQGIDTSEINPVSEHIAVARSKGYNIVGKGKGEGK